MEHSRLLLSNSLHTIFLLCIVSYSSSTNDSDHLTLLDFKNRIIEDPLQIMSSWNEATNFCNWVGVTCDSSNRVAILNLNSQRLTGSIPPSLGNLTFLTGLNLRNNSFSGQLPQELGRLVRLQYLNLTWNSFEGKIPTNLSRCTQLRVFDLVYNRLIGDIPDEISSLSKLMIFGLGGNNLTGNFPRWIGNFSSLLGISLALNNLQGTIPEEIGKLSNLGKFQIYGNYISGTIPSSIYNISSMYYFSVTQNCLHGKLPADIGLKFPNLEVFAGGVNNFTGPIPLSLSNASALQVLDFAENSLTGTIPRNLGMLQSLYRLNFDQNKLDGDLNFFNSLANCTSLAVLGIAENRFVGKLPSAISNLSTNLEILTLGSNFLIGKIPVRIENLINLSLLGLESNRLSGYVPDVIGKLQKLEGLHLNFNKFSGEIPATLGNLTALTRLFLEENLFEGRIPPSLGDCRNLLVMNLSSNNLSGSIPKKVMSLPSLSISLAISNNSLTGPIPDEVGSLKNLVELDLSENKISGEIPSTIGNCISFERLCLRGNFLEGTIPGSLESLRGIEEIDFSRNNLSGKIPEFLGKFLALRNLNLSYNDFEGNLSTQGVFANASAISLYGNKNLCGGISELKLPACSRKNPRNIRTIIIPVIASALFIILLFALYCIVKSSRNTRPHISESQEYLPYSELLKATDSFSAENLIGSGSFGSVYKGKNPFGHKKNVAIKVLDLQQHGASKSFAAEYDTLRSVRHRNLLKIITACSSIDHQGNEFKALVFEFMSNGNLDQWLHQDDDDVDRRYRLSFIQRLNIAIDVASALDYLHNYCEVPIVHCDLKPSNVLLDDDLVAHVGDFGLATFLLESSSDDSSTNQGMSTGLKGSIGYIPPEYGTTAQVSIHGDTYSFGMLLLEIFTGKRPTDEMFKDGLSIYNHTAMALPEHVLQITDPSMSFIENKTDESYTEITMDNEIEMGTLSKTEECLVSLFRIGLACSVTDPRLRMPMNVVVNKLQAVRDLLLKFKYVGSNFEMGSIGPKSDQPNDSPIVRAQDPNLPNEIHVNAEDAEVLCPTAEVTRETQPFSSEVNLRASLSGV